MANQTCYVTPLQADLIWRALWNEIERIDADLFARILSENTAHQEHTAAITMLQQINFRFQIVKDSTFEEMVQEARLPERKWA